MFSRFFRHFLLLFAVHLTSISMFRFIASIFQTVGASMTAGSSSILSVLLFGGFVIPKCKISISLLHSLCQSIFSSSACLEVRSFCCSLYASLVEVGILGFSFDIWRDRHNS